MEGLEGAAYIKFGLLLNYPNGEPEEIEISTNGVEWTKVNDVGTFGFLMLLLERCQVFKGLLLAKIKYYYIQSITRMKQWLLFMPA